MSSLNLNETSVAKPREASGIPVGDRDLTLEDVRSLLGDAERVSLSAESLDRVRRSAEHLANLARDRVIYGVNTGFGPMASCRIAPEDFSALQTNLIRSHALGAGAPLPDACVKATLIARLRCLVRGHSGVAPELVSLFAEMINRDILPVVPEHGGVGASGDLVQLAHVALAAIGEGEVRHQGRVRPTAEVFAENGIEPAPLRIREGLAMVNGTSAMTGIGLVTLLGARALFHWTLLAAALIQEILETYDDPFSPALSGLKAHPGQRRIAGRMTAILSDSRLIHRNGTASLPQNGGGSRDVQPSYSIRCIPQILGPILETLDCAEKIVVGELNSVSDNPAIDPDSGELLHGGNFHGDYVAHEMDKVKAAITKLSMLCERQLNHLLDDRLNGRLPPFVNLGRPGLDLGLQGAQFTATSTVAENQSLAMPVCVHSIPCNRDNQDIVSMGANAALLAKRVVDNSFQVLAIELVALLQAVDALEVQDRLATETRTLHRELREIVPVFREDTLTAADLRRLVDHLQVPRADHLTR